MVSLEISRRISAFLDKFIPAFSAADGNPSPASRHPDLLPAIRASIDMVILPLCPFFLLFEEKPPDFHLLLQKFLILGRTFTDVSGKHAIISKDHYDGSQYVKNPSAKK